jgi:hypothetical protein
MITGVNQVPLFIMNEGAGLLRMLSRRLQPQQNKELTQRTQRQREHGDGAALYNPGLDPDLCGRCL